MNQGKTLTKLATKIAVKQLVNFVKPTFGPANNTIMMRMGDEVVSLDDGVSAAIHFSLKDEFQNMVVDFVKGAAIKTSRRVRDATTTTLILIDGIVNFKSWNPFRTEESASDIRYAAEDAKAQLREWSKPVNDLDDLVSVAHFAYNNEAADHIARLVYTVGKDGYIGIEQSEGNKVEYKTIDGITFESGYISRFMGDEDFRAQHTEADILITERHLRNTEDILPLMEKLIALGKREVVIIAEDISDDALSVIVGNQRKGAFKTLAIPAMHRGDRKRDFLLDLCAITGAELITEGTEIKDVPIESLGSASLVLSTPKDTKIIGGNSNKDKIAKRAEYYDAEMAKEEKTYNVQELKKNRATLFGKIGIISVGAKTSQELKQMLPKIENCVSSTMAAFSSGVVPGAGMSLAKIKTTSAVLNQALKLPRKVLLENSKEEDLSELAVDSVEALCVAIDSSVSVACSLLSSKGMQLDNEK
jgi:chaperonin GroEL